VTVGGDLADPAVPSRLVGEATHRLGGLDILVANAATDRRVAPEAFDPVASDVEWAVNVRATLALALAALPAMRERRWGRILLLGSVQQVRPNPNQLVYAATKAAIANIAMNLAKQTAADGVTVNVLAPGAIGTATNAEVLADPAQRRRILGRIPMERIGQPDDVVGPALFLCSDAARYVTGIVLPADGGMHLR
jgi:NAD(P)-dependent dehydrogenase (short-subunit alcohol dehydrogenase family)